MASAPKGDALPLKLSFQGQWRSYQKRVLDELDTHLGNNSLHVVAAPGSGKTVLGLEVMRRLGKPALILSPTITIRNQWQERLCTMFLPSGSPKPEWLSLDIKAPRAVTAITYQALHAAFEGRNADQDTDESEEENGDLNGDTDSDDEKPRSNGSESEILSLLRAQKIGTLVLDEAHHLRNEWWKALIKLKDERGTPTVVALTATPPYDVEYMEWQRYQTLCGPIDAEISVPELVVKGDLCPHQDYVYFTVPRDLEAEKLAQFHSEVGSFIRKLLEHDELKAALSQFAWIANPMEHVEAMRYGQADFDNAFLLVDVIGEHQHDVVHLITELFARGGITALVGTQALLGEGWDAPSVNTLILASTVGSYMLSNQMRGRAIRIDPSQPSKGSNIWHLAAVDPSGPQAATNKTGRRRLSDKVDDLREDLGSDVDTLKRRFRAFEGLSFREPVTIENGFRRLALGGLAWNAQTIDQINGAMMEKAADREGLHSSWRQALKGDNPNLLMRESMRSNYVPASIAFYDAIKYLMFQAGFVIGLVLGEALPWAMGGGSLAAAAAILFYGFIAGLLATLPMTLKALWLWIRNGSLEGSMRQAGWTVLETLHRMGVITTALRELQVLTFHERGIVHCRLEGATTIERSHFMAALQELLSPIENPRYVLVRRSVWRGFKRTDYHAVPALIGQKKENAQFFARLWNVYVGSSKLVYTRSVEGRLTLLQARAKALSSAFRSIDRISRWQ